MQIHLFLKYFRIFNYQTVPLIKYNHRRKFGFGVLRIQVEKEENGNNEEKKKREEIGRRLGEIGTNLCLSTLDMKASTEFCKTEFRVQQKGISN